MRLNILMKMDLWTRIKPSLVLSFLVCLSADAFASNKEVISAADHYEFDQISQQVTIKGKVTSQGDNMALPGVNITVKGTKQGAMTDFDGQFSITVPSDQAVLIFSFMGYLNQEISIAGKTAVNVQMVPDSKALNEVVVVGYGVQKKATLTGAVETVKSEAFKDRPVTNPALALQGETPGLVVTRSSTRPGNENINLQIRGATSINGGTPLIVIDGIPAITDQSFYNMNSDDIESVTVLKDAAASIYGSRAANGVVLVTTKKGKKGVMRVDFNASTRINTIGIRPPVANMQGYAQMYLAAMTEDEKAGILSSNYSVFQNRDNLMLAVSGYEGLYKMNDGTSTYLANADRFDEMYGNAVSQQYLTSISGGSDKSTYRLSFGYTEDVGSLKTAYDGRQQYNLRFNNSYQLKDWAKLETGFSYINYTVSGPSNGLSNEEIYDPPFYPAQNPYGQWYANFGNVGNRNSVARTADGGRENTKRDQYNLNMALTLDLYKGLNFKLTGAYNRDFRNGESYVLSLPQYSWFGDLINTINATSNYKVYSENKTYQNYGGFLNYNRSFGNHNITGLLGITTELYEHNGFSASRDNFTDKGLQSLNLATDNKQNDASKYHYGFYSFIGRVNYAYKDKYLVEVSARRDGSSKFSSDNRWSNFGSANVGWVLTQEDFLKSFEALSFLKLRASYGEMGNQGGISNYDYLSTISYGTQLFGVSPAEQITSEVGAITSRDKTWERVGITNIGMDFSFLNKRLFGTVDIFKKRNQGMLINEIFPDILGGTPPLSNSGELVTKGWELTLGWRKDTGKFKYSASFNMGDSRNDLAYLGGASVITPGINKLLQGYSMNSIWVYKTDGYFANKEEADNYVSEVGSTLMPTNGTVRLRAGDTKRVDINGDGVIDESDLVFKGDTGVHYNYGINFSASYGGFDFSSFFQGVLENKFIRGGFMAYPYAAWYTNQPISYLGKTWTEENPDAEYPRLSLTNGSISKWNYSNNDFTIQNNRYIRLKSLVIGYTIPQVTINNIKLDKVRVYFAGNDLWELTTVKDGYDPEFGDSVSSVYPFNRTWSLGLNVSF